MRSLLRLDDAKLISWQRAVVDNLVAELRWLRRALSVQTVSFEKLPQSVRSRMIAANGSRLSVVTPAQDIAQVTELSTFITQVRDVVPNATGRPVIEWGVGNIVVSAFQQALIYAIACIGLVILLALRNMQTVLMIMFPLSLTAVFCIGGWRAD